MSRISGCRLFQSWIVSGQKLYLYSSQRVCRGMNFRGWDRLVFTVGLCSMYNGMLTAASLCNALCSRVSLATFLLCWSDGHWRWLRALVMQPCSDPYVLVAKRTAHLCTFSSHWIWYCRHGSQTVLAYSIVGLTREMELGSLFLRGKSANFA